MKPFFFGAEGKQLYGVYHRPVVPVAPGRGVLICYPLGHEYVYSHRSLSQLARRLSADGLHVLRFDYFGTGNSAGRSSEGTVFQWKVDIRDAAEELQEISGGAELSMLGLRAGAVLACAASIAPHGIRDLVLWDPVVSGVTYLEGLQETHEKVVGRRSNSPGRYDQQLLGFPYPEALRREIGDLNLLETPISAERIILLSSSPREETERLRAHLEDSTRRLEVCDVPIPLQWYTESREPCGLRLDGTTARKVSSLLTDGST